MKINLPFWFFVVCFIGLWWGVTFLMSKMSGWSTLAEQFRLRDKDSFTGQRKYCRWGKIGLIGYNNCLKVGVSQEGLYLALMPLFRVGSPPLLIPWMHVSKIETNKFLFGEEAVVYIGTPIITTVRIPGQFIEPARSWINPETFS